MRFFVLAALLPIAGIAKAAILDGIAAKVDDDVLTVGEVMKEASRRITSPGVLSSKDAVKELYRVSLEGLIEKRLILAAAKRKGMEMQEWVVENRIREIIKEGFGSDKQNLLAALDGMHTTYAEWKSMIREDLIVAAMRWQMVEKNILATPAAIRQEWTTNKTAYARPPKTTVSVILLKPADTDDPSASVVSRGAAILQKLEEGVPFADLAREYSADSHASQGGVWKDVDPEEAFREEIVETLEALKVGEHSQLVDLDGWGFIVRKDAETQGGEPDFAAVYDEVAAAVRKNLSQEAYNKWIARLKADAFVKTFPMPDDGEQ